MLILITKTCRFQQTAKRNKHVYKHDKMLPVAIKKKKSFN